MFHLIEDFFAQVVQYCVLSLEVVGVLIVMWTAIVCVRQLIRHDLGAKINLAEGVAIALEFKLAGEVLRTTLVRDWEELGILCAVMLIRAGITLLLHWEISCEKKKHL